MRRSVYIMLFIPLCFPGTMMDVIIIHIVILFNVETRTVATDMMSAASNSAHPSRSRRAKTSDFSNKRNAELKFYFVRSSAVQRVMIRSVFQNADLTCHGLTGNRRMRDGISAASFPLMPSSRLKTDICFPSLMPRFVTGRALSSSRLVNILFSFSIPFFPYGSSSLLRRPDNGGGLLQREAWTGPRMGYKARLIFPD